MSRNLLTHVFSQTKQFNAWKTIFGNHRKEFGRYSIVMPDIVTEKLHVPRYIAYPPYVLKSSAEDVAPSEPDVKTDKEIAKMRRSCSLARKVLDTIAHKVKVGITTDELDKIVHNLYIENNAYPSPLGFHGFPKSICTSVNNVVCHGVPDIRPLQNGDIISIDVSVFLDGFHGDCCDTYAVGDVDRKGLDLIIATKCCLRNAIAICHDGQEFCKIGAVINETANKLGYKVVPCFAGHGIGNYFHGPPDILHIENDYPGKMRTGMTFTIEPVLTQGEPVVSILEDGWTAITVDNARTAQFEHTILINGPKAEVLTSTFNNVFP